jgi:hypothetical protein
MEEPLNVSWKSAERPLDAGGGRDGVRLGAGGGPFGAAAGH